MEGHTPVLKTEILQAFKDVCGTVWDGTFGGGGHSEALLKQNPSLYIVATDTDPEAAELTGIDYVSGTSDALNTAVILDMMLAANPGISWKHPSAGFRFVTRVRSTCE